jgi:hypothetical protein
MRPDAQVDGTLTQGGYGAAGTNGTRILASSIRGICGGVTLVHSEVCDRLEGKDGDGLGRRKQTTQLTTNWGLHTRKPDVEAPCG